MKLLIYYQEYFSVCNDYELLMNQLSVNVCLVQIQCL